MVAAQTEIAIKIEAIIRKLKSDMDVNVISPDFAKDKAREL